MLFPRIAHIDDLRPHIADRPEINVTTHSNGFHVVCYSISGPNTFHDTDLVKQSFLRECRGITFYPNGDIASRPLHKFFNVGENLETQYQTEHLLELARNNDIARFMDKRDGSMLHPVLVNGKVVLKSKKSFTSDVAIKATQFLHLQENKNILDFCVWSMTEKGNTPIFEYTAPDNRIVLPYESAELRLLQMRDTVDGWYITDEVDLRFIAHEWDLTMVDGYDITMELKSKLDTLETTEQIEGYIIQFCNGNMLKLKTPWYLALHHSVTFTRERDVAEMVLDEQVDDYKSYLASVQDDRTMKRVQEIEARVLDSVNSIQWAVEAALNLTPDHIKANRKDFAQYHKGADYFSLVMKLYSGAQPEYKEFYRKHHLKDEFGLEQL